MNDFSEFFFTLSPQMEKIKAVVDEIAGTDMTVLIKGESGTGKEWVAQTIHLNSNRRGKPFIKVNCAAIPQSLLESELFGFERGAFTGADLKKPGKFELANGGTVLLNDISEIDIAVQAKLLQVLQDGEFSRLGGNGNIRVQSRVVATTKDNLEKSMLEGRFRQDLFFRINVISLTIPPLRDRREQIIPLYRHFFQLYTTKYGKVACPPPSSIEEKLLDHEWPGNIRELKNVVKRLILFGEEETVQELRKGQDPLIKHGSSAAAENPNGLDPRGSFALRRVGREAAAIAEREIIQKTLRETHWNRKMAAQALQVSYKALLYKIQKYRLNEFDHLRGLREDGA